MGQVSIYLQYSEGPYLGQGSIYLSTFKTVRVLIWDRYLCIYLSIYLQYCKGPYLGQVSIYLPAIL